MTRQLVTLFCCTLSICSITSVSSASASLRGRTSDGLELEHEQQLTTTHHPNNPDASRRKRRVQASNDHVSYVDVIGSCNYENVLLAYTDVHGSSSAAMAALTGHLGVSEASVSSAVAAACAGASPLATETIPFDKLAFQGKQFDQNFMDSGSNNDMAKARIHRAYDNGVMNYEISWPGDYISQFQDCPQRAVMCCRMGEEVSSSDDQVCSMDIQRAALSNYLEVGPFRGGYTMFHSGTTAQCTGFAWSNDPDDFTNKYRGNTLFEISLLEGAAVDGKNVPGAPMCGCLSSMPTVTSSKCVTVKEGYRFTFSSMDEQLRVSFQVQVVPCEDTNGNEIGLVDHYASLVSQDVASSTELKQLEKRIVGKDNCDISLSQEWFLQKGTYWWDYDIDKWTPFAGKDDYYEHFGMGSKEEFVSLFDSSPNKIVRRICRQCWETHRDIYYKRITPVPTTLDFYDNLLNNWLSVDNTLNVDFELYSSYEDALASQNKWTFCNYDHEGVGFPRDCGPEGYIPSNWASFSPEKRGKRRILFLVEK